MIVVDNDVLSYFWIDVETQRDVYARRVREIDPDWWAPPIWRAEFRSVLRRFMMNEGLALNHAITIMRRAEQDLGPRTVSVSSSAILSLVDQTHHSSYDCEYVALAQNLGLKLVSGDKRLVQKFPETAVLLEEFADA